MVTVWGIRTVVVVIIIRTAPCDWLGTTVVYPHTYEHLLPVTVGLCLAVVLFGFFYCGQFPCVAFSALMLLVGCLGGRKGIRPVKKYGGWWRWALVSLDGLALIRMVSVSASVNLPLHHKVQKFSSGTGSLGWSQNKGRKTVVVVVWPVSMC